MSVKFTEQSVLAVLESMKRAKLDHTKFALYLYLHEGNLSITFMDDINGSKQVGAIFVKVEDAIERFHRNNPLVIDYVTNGQKQGLIFLQEKQYERIANGKSG